ncbi:MAG TPA: ATP-binding protein [Solirubrobacterales bacterium]|nr:ATP-binding protein [Solirubrobacterales bacterium]
MATTIHDTYEMPTDIVAIDAARRWAEAHARRAAVDDAAIADLQLAMTEALSNVIRHSYEGRPGEQVQLLLDIDESRLALGIRDRGLPFDAERYRPPDLDQPADGGYGVFLIEELMDEVSRRPLDDGGGTLVELVRYRKERP